MSHPESAPQLPSHDDWNEDERRQFLEENQNAQLHILGPLLANPNLISQDDQVDAIFRYASLVGQMAEETLKHALLQHPESRVWNRLEQFMLHSIPELFARNPEIEQQYGLNSDDLVYSFHQAIEQAKLYKSLSDQELQLFHAGESLLGRDIADEDAFDLLKKEYSATFQHQYKRIGKLLQAFNMRNSTPLFVREDELKQLSEDRQLLLEQAIQELGDTRIKFQALLQWSNRVHLEMITTDLTREYITELIAQFGQLSYDVSAQEALATRMMELLDKHPDKTVSTSKTTARHKESIPANLPGDLAFHFTYTDTGDETTNRFSVQLSKRR